MPFNYNTARNIARTAGYSIVGSAARDAYRYGRKRLFRGSRRTYRPRGYSRWKRARYGRRARRYIGHPVRYGTAKRTQIVTVTSQSQNNRTLYSQDLTYIAHTSSNEVNKRQRDMINLRGFRINLQFKRDVSVLDRDLVLHMAIVHDKGRANAALTANDPIAIGDFFRGNADNRAVDFSSGLSGIEFNNLGINTDLYTVLKRKDYVLKSPTQNGRVGFRKKIYIKVNRQIRYDNEIAGLNEEVATDGRCFLVWWYNAAWGENVSSTPQLVGEQDRMVITYWREPPC